MKKTLRIFNQGWNIIIAFILIGLLLGCNKLVEVDPPANSIVTKQAFVDDANANAAISGIYSSFISKSSANRFGNGWMTYFCGLSADELVPVTLTGSPDVYYRNVVQSDDGIIHSVWSQAYGIIYQANACIEGVNNSKNISESGRRQFIGEALFLRSLSYYYLTSMFGDVPFITSTNWKENMAVPRRNVLEVQNEIIKDLLVASDQLPINYSLFQDERIRATKWACYALLCRLYLEHKKWTECNRIASLIIENTSLFGLEEQLNNVFLKNSREAILQWHSSSDISTYNVLPEASLLLPVSNAANLQVYLSNGLVNCFDSIDLRRINWIGEVTDGADTFLYPYKYKVGRGQMQVNAPVLEYYMVIRLAEVVLNRAIARVMNNDFSGGLADLNLIRTRAGLASLNSTSQDTILNMIQSESRKEMFCEWGHRWFSLKLSGALDSVMSKAAIDKNSQWASFRRLFPISLVELNNNPAATQNPGY
ncbi:RagB/SusD family nutrient uptake outer membrane protein [Pseudoflavitalea sp. X16]|uniref:RagB/SusD family nutrient uptake outer membrane protein n=1 Tax=Paraflavitalea devenefica TaxID=2716334 RepID=UPI00141F937C|nr:RagB/SusD family nutrient uptake outer membrane protein [Paraflavitalea devenefica]NII26145.1 RagB/SusD family nutrient uptake outer membrane protein [Paraflavitalea devenefica]